MARSRISTTSPENSQKSKITQRTSSSRKYLTGTQLKTIAALREMGLKQQSRRALNLKGYRAFLHQKAEQAKGPKKVRAFVLPKKWAIRINFGLPVTVSKDALVFLQGLTKKSKAGEKNATVLEFQSRLGQALSFALINKAGGDSAAGPVHVVRKPEKGAKNFDNAGLVIEFDKKSQEPVLLLRYPIGAPALRSPSYINQGDLAFRTLISSKKTTADKVKKEEDIGRSFSKNKSTDSSEGGQASASASSQDKKKVFEDWSGVLSDIHLDNVAWHDFAQYHYVSKPVYLRRLPPRQPDYHIDNTTQKLEEQSVSSSDIEHFVNQLSKAFSKTIMSSVALVTVFSNRDQAIESIISRIFEGLSLDPSLLADLAEVYWSLTPPLDPCGSSPEQLEMLKQTVLAFVPSSSWIDSFFNDNGFFFNVLVGAWSVEALYHLWCQAVVKINEMYSSFTTTTEVGTQEGEGAGSIIDDYPFLLYWPGSWNLGLRLVYRQEWRPLGDQRGEIVKTIPLGPKQVEKVSTRILRRTKVTHTSENMKSTEVTTETSDTTKDSSEVVDEASKSNKWNINQEAEGGYNCGVWHVGGKTSGGYESQSSDSSKETSSHLSEAMQKTANKIRTETKVVVTTESESTFETTVASEIQNPNDEIAITYIYSKLQRQYEIFTGLAEVQNVIMIAEPIWFPEKITAEWVKKYDWILAKVLLDDSFREVLASFSQDSPKDALAPEVVQQIGKNVTATTAALGTLAGNQGALSLSQMDVSQEAQRAYRETQREEIENKRGRALLEQKQNRFLQHIRENILYYSRAIWSQEDPQQRMLRYRKLGLKVPLQWKFVGEFEGVEWDGSIGNLLDMIIANQTGDRGQMLDSYITGDFIPVDGSDEVDLADLINLAGPIGFEGNYAIYYMRPEYSGKNIFPMLQILETPYLYYPEGNADDPKLMDPFLKKLIIDNAGKGPMNEDEKLDMTQYVPELRLKYAIAGSLAAMESDDPEIFKAYFPEYLFRKEQSRRFLLETNNVVVDIFEGTGSALEQFKREHRKIDVEKATEEKTKLQLENERRRKLLDAKRYGDPDIEKVVEIRTEKPSVDAIVADEDSD